MKRNKAPFSVLLLYVAALILIVGAGCRSGPDKEGSVPGRVSVPIPDMLQRALGGYTLQAEITISDVGTLPMDVDQDAKTAYFEKNLYPGDYTLTVTYFVMIDGDRCILATQSQPATIYAYKDSHVQFSASEYDTTMDDDKDNVTNLLEVTYSGEPFNGAVQPPYECVNGVDDDGWGDVDYPNDPGCTAYDDATETNLAVECDDRIDNDMDGLVDMNAPGCTDPTDNSEWSVAAISAGVGHTCALTSTGEVKCWGNNEGGQLGNGSWGPDMYSTTPVDVVGLTSGVAAITAGNVHSCALTSTGGVKCWGFNFYGQLGDGTKDSSNTPVDVCADITCSAPLSGVEAIAAGLPHTCALTSTGGVKCWGFNFYGELGDGKNCGTLCSTPVDVVGLTSGVAAIAAGGDHTCALTDTGGVKCWGTNNSGQLGDGQSCGTDYCTTPVDVTGLTSGVAAIAAGDYHTCALSTAGDLNCWGHNAYGQLGAGFWGSNRLTPVDVVGLTSGVAVIAAGRYHTCALTSTGEVKCWGDNWYGQLGDGRSCGMLCSTPVDVVGLTSGVEAIAAGGHYTCALTDTGGVKCWGRNDYGQLGNGTTMERHTPVDVVW